MSDHLFKIKSLDTTYKYSVFKDAIGDINVVNGTMDDEEIEVEEPGYIKIFYKGDLAVCIYVDDINSDYINWYDCYKKGQDSISHGTGVEHEIEEELEDFISDLETAFNEKEDDKETISWLYCGCREKSWKEYFENLLNECGFKEYSLEIEVIDNVLPDFKEFINKMKSIYENAIN